MRGVVSPGFHIFQVRTGTNKENLTVESKHSI
jgi:hypothetical protein